MSAFAFWHDQRARAANVRNPPKKRFATGAAFEKQSLAAQTARLA